MHEQDEGDPENFIRPLDIRNYKVQCRGAIDQIEKLMAQMLDGSLLNSLKVTVRSLNHHNKKP